MKYAVAVLLGVSQAVKLNDAPPAFNQPSFTERMPAAAGLSQVKSGDAPPAFNQPAFTERMPAAAGLHQMTPPDFREPIDPSKERWAWNETMKSSAGLHQSKLVQTACDLSQTKGVSCTPMSLAQEDPKVGANQAATAIVREKFSKDGYPQPEKVLVLDPKIARTHSTFFAQEDPKVGANQEANAKVRKDFNNTGYPQPEKVLVLDPKIARTHSTFFAQGDPDPAEEKEEKLPLNQRLTNIVRSQYNNKGYGQPEKDLVLDPKSSRVHTSFYAQNLVQKDEKKEEAPLGINQQMTATVRENYTTAGYGGGPEKDLIEDPKIARRSTTFYAQLEGDDKDAAPAKGINQIMSDAVRKGYTTAGYGEGPEKDLIEDPKIARRSTTFYAQLEGDDKDAAPLGINQQMTKTVRDNYTTAGYGGGPEKDLIEDPKIARRSTTFYAQVAGDDKDAAPLGINQQMTKTVRENYTTKGYGEGPEKDLIEDPKIARRSTTFYAQAEPEKVGANQEATAEVREKFSKDGYPQPEKVLVLDPKIARTHSTFMAQSY